MGSGVQTQFHTNLQKPDAGHFNAGARWTAKSLAEILGEFFFDDLGAVGGQVGRIIGGMRWEIPLSTIKVDIDKGAIAWKHVHATSGLTAVINGAETVPETLLALMPASSIGIADNVSGDERIDIIAITWTIITDNNLSMPQKIPTLPIPQDTRWSASASFAVVQGTPAAGPPSVAVNQQPVFQVTIPDGTTAANFDVNGTVLEFATPATSSRVGPAGSGYTVGLFQGGTEGNVIQSQKSAGNVIALRHGHSGASPNLDTDNYPRWRRTAMPSNEAGQDLFPLVNPGGRTWTILLPFSGANERHVTGTATDIESRDFGNQVEVERLTIATTQYEWNGVFHLPARGLQIVEYTIHWDIDTATDCTILNQLFRVAKVEGPTGLVTTLSTVSPDFAVAGAAKSHNFAPVNVIVEDMDYLLASLAFGFQNDGAAIGQITLHGIEVTVREARS